MGWRRRGPLTTVPTRRGGEPSYDPEGQHHLLACEDPMHEMSSLPSRGSSSRPHGFDLLTYGSLLYHPAMTCATHPYLYAICSLTFGPMLIRAIVMVVVFANGLLDMPVFHVLHAISFILRVLS